MGVGCCSGGASQGGASQNATPHLDEHHGHDHGHGHGHDHGHGHRSDHAPSHCAPEVPCAEEGECCDDESCCGDDATSNRSATLACCDSNEERCDEKCILAAAALECEKTCESDAAAHHGTPSHEHAHDEDGHHPASACSTHLAKAFDQYSAYLESARCICRGILERGWSTTCCGKQPKPPAAAAAADAVATAATEAVGGHEGTYATGHGLHQHHGPHHHHGVKRRGNKGRHDHGEPALGSGKEADCCSGHEVEHGHGSENKVGVRPAAMDLEKAQGLEHIALTVDGMTCSGCGNKMTRTLKALPGVSTVRVNFVMGSAEFSLDTSAATPDEVIRSVQRATGFRCTRLSNDDETLDLLASGVSAKALADVAIPGVTQAVILNKRVVRITYDPAIIGARTLVDQVGALSGGLAPPRDDPNVSSGRKRLYDQLIKTVVAACFTIPVVVLAWGHDLVNERIKAFVSIVLATIVQLIAVPDFYHPAISALVHSGSLEMDMLVVISITAAYTYSVVAFGFMMAGNPLETEAFFETSTLLITLVLLGRLVAAFARIRAVVAVSLRSLQSATAVIVEDGKDREVDARLLQYGDKLKIGPHSAVPTDATVLTGSSDVVESMLTGESAPVFKKEGDAVIAGTINGTGTLVARLTRLPGKNTVTDIAQLVEEAANSKPRLQDVADRVASWFVPVVTSVAVVVVIVWVIVGIKVRHYSTGKTISNAITYAVATLAVSCPCAIGLAVPMVLVVAGGIAARSGVIIKSAECTEQARRVTDVVFDKTGTITEGDLDVMDEEYLIPDREEAIAISKALVAGNKHPVSLAVAKHLEQHATPEATVASVHVIPGAGVEATLDDAKLRAGNPKWTETSAHATVVRLHDRGMTLLVVTRSAEPIAVFGLRTRLRAEAARVIAQLSRRGIVVHLVSGDQKRAVEAVAAQVAIPHVASQCTPAEKRDYVAGLMAEGKKVMFVGDGTNDAVAVTQADVGVQLASVLSASEVTRGAADVVLLRGLEGIPFLLQISGVAFRRMVFNFAWSAAYNVLAILLASGAFVDVRIPPAYAGLGEIVSVLPVIVAAMTMLLKKIKTEDFAA
ncbi:P-type cation-transporting ATPase [Tolypocladium capitatum]|uniref:P-type cation-transporting ATPase n=1 Tax=Tolypocladium capitatum TaxID=45235 RepID=A0A2K3Q975_9HYPO|nr:P-type cation-transporting ATPase [Tolypocladium capitatum]